METNHPISANHNINNTGSHISNRTGTTSHSSTANSLSSAINNHLTKVMEVNKATILNNIDADGDVK